MLRLNSFNLGKLRRFDVAEQPLSYKAANHFLQTLERGGLGAIEKLEFLPGSLPSAQKVCTVLGQGRAPMLKVLSLAGIALGNKEAEEVARLLDGGFLALLENLNLSNCQIGVEGGKLVCEALERGKAPKLKHLNLSGNSLLDVGAESLVRCLEKGGLPDLETLKIVPNNIGQMVVIRIFAAICENQVPKLRDWRDYEGLQINAIETEKKKELVVGVDEQAAGILARALETGRLVGLEKVDLSGSLLGERGANLVFEALAKARTPKIKEIVLKGANLDDSGAVSLSELLDGGGLGDLERVDLSGNSIGVKGALQLFSSLQKGQTPKLQTVDLSGTPYCTDRKGMRMANRPTNLVELASDASPVLEKFDSQNGKENLDDCELGDFFLLLCGLVHAGKIRDVRRIRFRKVLPKLEQLEALGGALGCGGLEGLEALELTGEDENEETGKGAPAIFQELQQKKAPTLKVLKFSDISLGHNGALSLAGALESGGLSELTELEMGNAGMDAESVVAISEQLERGKAPNLSSLNLSKNKNVGAKGIRGLAEALESGNLRQMMLLVLSDCEGISLEGRQRLAKAKTSGKVPRMGKESIWYGTSSSDKD